MYKKFLILLIFLLAGSTLLPHAVFAAKKRVKTTATNTGSSNSSSTSFSKVAFFPNRLGLNINFFNLGKISKVSYVLSYTGSGKAQGVVGSFAPVGTSDARQLLFGTCSGGACVYHNSIKNGKLTLTFTLKNGKSAVKRYILKV